MTTEEDVRRYLAGASKPGAPVSADTATAPPAEDPLKDPYKLTIGERIATGIDRLGHGIQRAANRVPYLRGAPEAVEQGVAGLGDWAARGFTGLGNAEAAVADKLGAHGLAENTRRGVDVLKDASANIERYAPARTKAGIAAKIGSELVAEGVKYMAGGEIAAPAMEAAGIARVAPTIAKYAPVAALDAAQRLNGPENTMLGAYSGYSEARRAQGKNALPGAGLAEAIAEDPTLSAISEPIIGGAMGAVLHGGISAVKGVAGVGRAGVRSIAEAARDALEHVDPTPAVGELDAARSEIGQLPASDKTPEGIRAELAHHLDQLAGQRFDSAESQISDVQKALEQARAANETASTAVERESAQADYDRLLDEYRTLEAAPKTPYSPLLQPGEEAQTRGGRGYASLEPPAPESAAPVEATLPTQAEVAAQRAGIEAEQRVASVDATQQMLRRQQDEQAIAEAQAFQQEKAAAQQRLRTAALEGEAARARARIISRPTAEAVIQTQPRVIAEGIPGTRSAGERVPGMADAAPDVRAEYGRKRLEAVRDVVVRDLDRRLGINTQDALLSGTWEHAGSPNMQVVLPRGVPDEVKQVYAAAMGHAAEQDAVPWITVADPHPGASELRNLTGEALDRRRAELGVPGEHGAVIAETRRPLSIAEVDALAQSLPDGVNFTNTGKYLVFSNFSKYGERELSDRAMADAIAEAFTKSPIAQDAIEHKPLDFIRHDGELLGDKFHDGSQWQAAYADAAARLSRRGGAPSLPPDLLRTHSDRLAGRFSEIDTEASRALEASRPVAREVAPQAAEGDAAGATSVQSIDEVLAQSSRFPIGSKVLTPLGVARVVVGTGALGKTLFYPPDPNNPHDTGAFPLLVAAGALVIPERLLIRGAEMVPTVRVAQILTRASLENMIHVGESTKILLAARSAYDRPFEEQVARLRKGLVKDVRTALDHPDATVRNGVTWYKQDIAKMERAAVKRFPSLEDPAHKTLFRALLAMTSPNTDPLLNMRKAATMYDNFLKTGELDHFAPDVPGAINSRDVQKKLDRVAAMWKEVGPEGTEQWIMDHGRGFETRKGEGLFGPKTGPFFMNLSGDGDYATVDIWATRTARRNLGYMKVSPMIDQDAIQALRQQRSAGMENVADNASAVVHDDNGDVLLNIDSNPTDTERKVIAEAMKQAAEEISASGLKKMRTADVQAATWYLEKHLYAEKGAPDSGMVGFAEAFDRWQNPDAKVAAQRAGRAMTRGRPTAETTLYSTPVAGAMKTLTTRAGASAAAAGLGAVLAESDNKKLHDTGVGIIGLAALHAIGTANMARAAESVGTKIVESLRNHDWGYNAILKTNPDALIPHEILEGLDAMKETVSKGEARSKEFAGYAQKLGPAGDRILSDILEGEHWEDAKPEQVKAVAQVAAQVAAELTDWSMKKVQAGILNPATFDEFHTGENRAHLPRKYAYWEAMDALGDKRSADGVGKKPRVEADKRRTLDEPMREQQAKMAEAQQRSVELEPAIDDLQAKRDLAVKAKQGLRGVDRDKAAVKIADYDRQLNSMQAELTSHRRTIANHDDEMARLQYEQLDKRVALGEIREASYRIRQGIAKQARQVAAAEFLKLAKNTPGTLHPEYERALDDFLAAKDMYETAGSPSEFEAARGLLDESRNRMREVASRFVGKPKGQYIALPDNKSLGALSGAVVTREVANAVNGIPEMRTIERWTKWWKKTHTVYNIGTHVGNTFSNPVAAHMGGLHLWEQPLAAVKAVRDMRKYGPATRALTESGDMNMNVVFGGGEGAMNQSPKSKEALAQLMETTRPETAEVLAERGIKMTPDGMKKQLITWLKNGDARATKFYNHEDNIFRVMVYQHALDRGMSPEEAIKFQRETLGDYSTHSPALRALSATVQPFVMYTAKVMPKVAKNIVDHPFRWMTLASSWALLDMYSAHKEGEIPEPDIAPRDRAGALGYLMPGLTQLPFKGPGGDKVAFDVSRWTPFSAMTSNAPPGSAGAQVSDTYPAALQPNGPAWELGLRAYGLDPYTGEREVSERHGAPGVAKFALKSAASLALPSMLSFHLPKVMNDVEDANYAAAATDALGFLGAKPRYIQAGKNEENAAYEMDMQMRGAKQDLTKALRNIQGDGAEAMRRRQKFIRQYQSEVARVMKRYKSRMGIDN